MYKIILLVCCSFLLINAEFFDIEHLNRECNGTILIDQKQINGLYQLMKDFDELMNTFNIEYWVQGGTLAGVVRHQGLIAWDDDIDVNVKQEDVEKIYQLKPYFEALGYEVHRAFWGLGLGIVLYFRDTQRAIILDVFPMIHEDGKTVYVRHNWQRNNQPLYLYDDELYPLRRYPFGEIEVWGPAQPHVYLSCGFGEDYMNNIVIYNHKMSASYICHFADIAPKFQTYARMSVPLEDRVSSLLNTKYY